MAKRNPPKKPRSNQQDSYETLWESYEHLLRRISARSPSVSFIERLIEVDTLIKGAPKLSVNQMLKLVEMKDAVGETLQTCSVLDLELDFDKKSELITRHLFALHDQLKRVQRL